jgi:hypothetical protein
VDSIKTCQHCCQNLLLIEECPCRNYRVWREDHSEHVARPIKASSHRMAGIYFIERFNAHMEDEEEIALLVKNYQGEVKRVNITASVQIEFEAEVEEVEEQEATA